MRNIEMAKFAPGNSGRPKGSRNRLTGDFIGALADEFAEHGAEAIRIVRVERPHEFLKIVASLMPKELEITDNRLKDISDDELDFFIDFAKRQLELRPVGGDVEGGEIAPPDREPIALLSPIPEAKKLS
jgi:hypothetical protein